MIIMYRYQFMRIVALLTYNQLMCGSVFYIIYDKNNNFTIDIRIDTFSLINNVDKLILIWQYEDLIFVAK